MISFTIGEIVSIAIAIVLGILNIIQFYKKRGIFKPISNSLVGLFNDVKDKLILCNGTKNKLWNQQYPYSEAAAVKWDYDSYIFAMTEILYGFQEHIVALLKSLEVSDDKVFQAINFGLTEDEKEQRKIYMKNLAEAQKMYQKKLEEIKKEKEQTEAELKDKN